jgi:hypothetical protein
MPFVLSCVVGVGGNLLRPAHADKPSAALPPQIVSHHVARQQARQAAAKADALLKVGKYDEAFSGGLDVLQIGERNANNKGSLGLLTNYAIQNLPAQTFDASLPKLSSSQARTQADRLSGMVSSSWTLSQALRVEKTEFFQNLINGYKYKGDKGLQEVEDELTPRGQVPQKVTYARISKEATRCWRTIDQSPSEPYRKAGLAPQLKVSRIVTENLPYDLNRLRLLDCVFRVRQRFLLVRLWLQEYHGKRGAYPASLNVLPSGNLKQISDPFSPQLATIRYRVQGRGYVLWSLGPDGVDNRGTAIQPPGPGKSVVKEDSRGDIVYATTQ